MRKMSSTNKKIELIETKRAFVRKPVLFLGYNRMSFKVSAPVEVIPIGNHSPALGSADGFVNAYHSGVPIASPSHFDKFVDTLLANSKCTGINHKRINT